VVNLGGHRQPSGTSARLAQLVVALKHFGTQALPAMESEAKAGSPR